MRALVRADRERVGDVRECVVVLGKDAGKVEDPVPAD